MPARSPPTQGVLISELSPITFLDDPTDRTGWVTHNSLAVLGREAPTHQPVRVEAKP